MKILLAISLTTLSLLMPQASIGQHPDQRSALLKVDRAWSGLASKGKDVEGIVAFWSDDATVYPGGSPAIHGKKAIREFVKSSLATPGFHISWKPERATVSADGTLGYTAGTNSMTVPGKDGKLMTISARYVSVWKRHRGGKWRCVEDITISTGP